MVVNDAAGFSALSLVLGEEVVPQEAAQEVSTAKRRHRQRSGDEAPELLPEYYAPSKYAELPDEAPSPEEAAAAVAPAAPVTGDEASAQPARKQRRRGAPAGAPGTPGAPAAPQSVFVASTTGISPWAYVGIAGIIGVGIFFFLKKKKK